MTRPSIWRLTYLLFIVIISQLAYFLIHSPQNGWVIPVIFTLSLLSAGTTLKKRLLYLLLTGLSLVITSFLSSFMSGHHVILLLYLTVIILLYMRYIYTHLLSTRIFILFVFLTMVLGGKHVMDESMIERTSIIALGVMIAMLSQAVFWKVLIKDKLTTARRIAVLSLRHLNQAIFFSLLGNDSEKRIRMANQDFFMASRILYELGTERRDLFGNLPGKALMDLTGLYENTLDYAQIRWRLTDKAVFEMCAKELSLIQAGIDQALKEKMSGEQQAKVSLQVNALLAGIDQLERLYHQVMRALLRDPIAMLLFITSLRRMSQRLEGVVVS